MSIQLTASKQPMVSISAQQIAGIDKACGRIAPVWPLDQMIAVNPFWEMRNKSFAQVSARLSALSHAHCLMPKSYYAQQWQQDIQAEHLLQAATELGIETSIDALLAHLDEDNELNHWHNISDLLDSDRDRQHKMAWRDEITHQISQFCAAYFKTYNTPQDQPAVGTLYRQWLTTTRQDPGIEILMDESGLTSQFDQLPDDYWALMCIALNELQLDENAVANYCHALLLDINGWASWVAYLRWQDRLDGRENMLLRELLAIRMAWEIVLWRHQQQQTSGSSQLAFIWKHQLNSIPALIDAHREAQQLTWVWQRAHELAYQNSLHEALRTTDTRVDKELLVQAAFCIDVRSEMMRRHLEAQHAGIRTLGFAGFFGLPLEYQPEGTALSRPQLPGLLRSTIRVTDKSPDGAEITSRQGRLNRQTRWTNWCNAAPA